jgi:hypothetical protein
MQESQVQSGSSVGGAKSRRIEAEGSSGRGALISGVLRSMSSCCRSRVCWMDMRSRSNSFSSLPDWVRSDSVEQRRHKASW